MNLAMHFCTVLNLCNCLCTITLYILYMFEVQILVVVFLVSFIDLYTLSCSINI